MKLMEYFKLIRIKHWIKNIFLFVPLVFSKHIFDVSYSSRIVIAFFAFSFLSSIVYIINDIIDRDSDRNHPQKKFRPLAAGTISINSAVATAVLLLIANTPLSVGLGFKFVAISGGYFALNVFYSLYAKNVVLLDLFCIAGGFMLRVIAGAFAIDVEISSWLLLTTMFLSLFLAIMKRRSELTLSDDSSTKPVTRKVLESYSINFTDQLAAVSSSAVIICYALYTMADRTIAAFRTANLIYTTPFVVFGIFRYMYLVHKQNQGENTTEVMLTDRPMIITTMLYLLVTVLIIYYHS